MNHQMKMQEAFKVLEVSTWCLKLWARKLWGIWKPPANMQGEFGHFHAKLVMISDDF